MWLYIDDVLVLDIGGIHEPVHGTINFTTGEVKTWPQNDPSNKTTTSLQESSMHMVLYGRMILNIHWICST
jgi:fibro-slime domain-containing protein